MSYQSDAEWRAWTARLVADTSILTHLLRDGAPSLPIAREVIEAMGLLAAEWRRAVVAVGAAYSQQLDPAAVDRLRQVVRQLEIVSTTLGTPLAAPDRGPQR